MNEHRFRLEKTFTITSLADNETEDIAYWHQKTPQERLAALETMRQVAYGYDPSTTRFQRFFEIVART